MVLKLNFVLVLVVLVMSLLLEPGHCDPRRSRRMKSVEQGSKSVDKEQLQVATGENASSKSREGKSKSFKVLSMCTTNHFLRHRNLALYDTTRLPLYFQSEQNFYVNEIR